MPSLDPKLTKFLVVVVPRRQPNPQVQQQSQTWVQMSSRPGPTIKWIEAANTEQALAQVDIPPGAKAFCAEESVVECYRRPETAPLVRVAP